MQASQRRRVLAAVVEQVHRLGYAATTIGDIVTAAQVSRETFYELFAGKAAAYGAARIDFASGLPTTVGRRATDPWRSVEMLLRDYFEAVSGAPEAARCFLVESPAERRSAVRREAVELPLEAGTLMALLGSADRFACEGFIAMVRRRVAEEVDAGRAAELPSTAAASTELLRRLLVDAG